MSSGLSYTALENLQLCSVSGQGVVSRMLQLHPSALQRCAATLAAWERLFRNYFARDPPQMPVLRNAPLLQAALLMSSQAAEGMKRA